MGPSDPAPLPGAGADVDEPREAAIVRAFLASLELLDVERALSHVAEDLVYTNVSLPSIRGREGLRRGLTAFSRVATGFEAHNHRLAADGPVVLTERTDVIEVGRLRLVFWVCGTFEVHHGKITLWRDYFDWVDVTRATLRGLAGVVVPSLRAVVPAAR